MKKFLAFAFVFLLMACTKDGTVIEVKETSPGKFTVVDERKDDNSYVIVRYMNGQVKSMTFDQAEQFMASNPPSPAGSAVFQNYGSAPNSSGLTLSDLFLYHMMFGNMGGSTYHTRVIERYPTYYTSIRSTKIINKTYSIPRQSTGFKQRSSGSWSSIGSKSATPSSYSSRSSTSWSTPSYKPPSNSYSSSRSSSSWSNPKSSSFSSRSSSSWGSSSRSSYGSRSSFSKK